MISDTSPVVLLRGSPMKDLSSKIFISTKQKYSRVCQFIQSGYTGQSLRWWAAHRDISVSNNDFSKLFCSFFKRTFLTFHGFGPLFREEY